MAYLGLGIWGLRFRVWGVIGGSIWGFWGKVRALGAKVGIPL